MMACVVSTPLYKKKQGGNVFMLQNIHIQVGVANHPGRMLLMLCPICYN